MTLNDFRRAIVTARSVVERKAGHLVLKGDPNTSLYDDCDLVDRASQDAFTPTNYGITVHDSGVREAMVRIIAYADEEHRKERNALVHLSGRGDAPRPPSRFGSWELNHRTFSQSSLPKRPKL